MTPAATKGNKRTRARNRGGEDTPFECLIIDGWERLVYETVQKFCQGFTLLCLSGKHVAKVPPAVVP